MLLTAAEFAFDPFRHISGLILLCRKTPPATPYSCVYVSGGDPVPRSAKQALIQLPHIRRRFRLATIPRSEMRGERKASNTIR